MSRNLRFRDPSSLKGSWIWIAGFPNQREEATAGAGGDSGRLGS